MANQSFSERHGFEPEPAPITVRQDAPYDLRGLVPQLAYQCGFSPKSLRPVVCRVTMRVEDPNNWSEYPNIEGEVRDILYGCEWFEVYDIIEAIATELIAWDERSYARADDARYSRFESLINRAFFRHGIGWQLKEGCVEYRGEEIFETVTKPIIEELEQDELTTTAQELREALRDLSRRPNPDITGAIQHACGALDALSRKATGDKSAFGKLVKDNPDLFPRPLDDALHKIWGYASNIARHPQEGRDAPYAEAEFALTAAAAAVTYLKRKLDQDKLDG